MEEIWEWCQAHRRLAVAGVVSLGLVLGGVWLLMRINTPQPAAAPLASASSRPAAHRGSASSSRRDSSTSPLYVDVKGAVGRPGLYRVKGNMRVADVIAMAKGLTPLADQRRVNLAAKVADQQVLYVPQKGETGPAASTPATAASAGGTTAMTGDAETGAKKTVNINTADVAAFQTIKGIGQKKAAKIIAYRDQHGPFKAVTDLKRVGGFGDKTIAKLKDQLTV